MQNNANVSLGLAVDLQITNAQNVQNVKGQIDQLTASITAAEAAAGKLATQLAGIGTAAQTGLSGLNQQLQTATTGLAGLTSQIGGVRQAATGLQQAVSSGAAQMTGSLQGAAQQATALGAAISQAGAAGAQAATGMQQVTVAAQQTTQATQQLSTASTGALNNFMNIAKAAAEFMIVREAIRELSDAIGGIIDQAKGFQTQMTIIQNFTNASAQTFQQMSDEVLELSRHVKDGPEALAQSLYYVESAGYDFRDAMVILTDAAEAATAGLGSTSDVTKILTSVLVAYHAPASAAATITDELIAAVTQGKVPIDDLTNAIGRVLPLASALGVSFDQALADISTLTQEGLSADQASTALAAVLKALADPSEEVRKELAAIGLTAADVTSELRDKGLIPVLDDLMDRVHGNTQAIEALFPNIRSLQDVLGTAATQNQRFVETEDAITNSSGKTAQAYQAMQQTFEVQTAELQHNIEAWGIIIGSSLGGAFSNLLAQVNDFLNSEQFIAWAAEATADTEKVLAGLGALATGFGTAMGAIAQIAGDVIGIIIELYSILNPFIPHSPPLVDSVQTGMAAILDAYQNLGQQAPAALQAAGDAISQFATLADTELAGVTGATEQADLKALAAFGTDLPAAYLAAKDAIAQLRPEEDALRVQIADQQQVVEKAKSAVTSYKREIQSLQDEVKAAEAALRPLNDQIHGDQEALDGLDAQLATVNAAIQRFTEQYIQPLIDQQDQWKTATSETTSEIDSLQAQLAEAELPLQSYKDAAQNASDALKGLKDAAEQLNQTPIAGETALQQQIDAQQATVAQIRAQSENWAAAHVGETGKNAPKNPYQAQEDRANAQLSSLQAQMDVYRAERQQITDAAKGTPAGQPFASLLAQAQGLGPRIQQATTAQQAAEAQEHALETSPTVLGIQNQIKAQQAIKDTQDARVAYYQSLIDAQKSSAPYENLQNKKQGLDNQKAGIQSDMDQAKAQLQLQTDQTVQPIKDTISQLQLAEQDAEQNYQDASTHLQDLNHTLSDLNDSISTWNQQLQQIVDQAKQPKPTKGAGGGLGDLGAGGAGGGVTIPSAPDLTNQIQQTLDGFDDQISQFQSDLQTDLDSMQSPDFQTAISNMATNSQAVADKLQNLADALDNLKNGPLGAVLSAAGGGSGGTGPDIGQAVALTLGSLIVGNATAGRVAGAFGGGATGIAGAAGFAAELPILSLIAMNEFGNLGTSLDVEHGIVTGQYQNPSQVPQNQPTELQQLASWAGPILGPYLLNILGQGPPPSLVVPQNGKVAQTYEGQWKTGTAYATTTTVTPTTTDVTAPGAYSPATVITYGNGGNQAPTSVDTSRTMGPFALPLPTPSPGPSGPPGAGSALDTSALDQSTTDIQDDNQKIVDSYGQSVVSTQQDSNKLRDIFLTAKSQLEDVWNGIISALGTFVTNFGNTLTGWLNDLAGGLGELHDSWDKANAQALTDWNVFLANFGTWRSQVGTAIQGQITDVKNWLTGGVDSFVAQWDKSNAQALTNWNVFLANFGDWRSQVGAAIGGFISDIGTEINGPDGIIPHFVQMVADITAQLGAAKDAVMTGLGNIKDALTDGAFLDSVKTEAESIGSKIIEGIQAGLASLQQTITTDMGNALSNAVTDIKNRIPGQAASIGSASNDGVSTGMHDSLPQVTQASQAVANQSVQAMKQTLQIASPAQVPRLQVGQPSGQGFIQGLQDLIPDAQQAATNLVTSTVAAGQQAASAIGSWGLNWAATGPTPSMGAYGNARDNLVSSQANLQAASLVAAAAAGVGFGNTPATSAPVTGADDSAMFKLNLGGTGMTGYYADAKNVSDQIQKNQEAMDKLVSSQTDYAIKPREGKNGPELGESVVPPGTYGNRNLFVGPGNPALANNPISQSITVNVQTPDPQAIAAAVSGASSQMASDAAAMNVPSS